MKINNIPKKLRFCCRILLIGTLFLLLFLSKNLKFAQAEEKTVNNIQDLLEIPTIEEIKAHGYPTNKNGLTYGPDIKESLYVPDLILARNKDGLLGYIYNNSSSPASPDEALEYNQLTSENTSILMYLQDGITIIGTFSN